jgi:hypothetical protein
MADGRSRPIRIDHPRIRLVEPDVFLARFAPDCMAHDCRCVDEGDRSLPDACCQHGADVDLYERDAIRARAEQIAPVLAPPFQDPARWFDESEPEHDPEVPSGVLVRTGRAGPGEADGCVFLQHDARGCALHRAALQHGFDPSSIKPAVCRLYPIAWGEGTLGLSDDFERYSCAGNPEWPTVWQVMRATVGDIFGLDVVRLLDDAERRVTRTRLRVVAAR